MKCTISKRHGDTSVQGIFCDPCWELVRPATRRSFKASLTYTGTRTTASVYDYWYWRGKAVAEIRTAQFEQQLQAKQGGA